MVLRRGLPVFRIFDRHALNTSRTGVYDDNPPSSDYSIVTLKSNGGKDVTQIGGSAGGEVLLPLSVGLRDHVLRS
jgi:hypothetical protein